MNDITGVILVAGVLALVGAVLLWRGLRGKLQGDHPYCRRCGRNLFGTTNAPVCPECGADLGVPRAVVIGVRQRRAGMALSGAAMLLPGVLTLLTVIGAVVSGVDWTKHKPPWLLVHEAQSKDVLVRDTALAELNSRFTAGTMSNVQAAKVVEAGLDYQGHAELPWSIGWGDFIEAARGKGIVSEDQWTRYAKQAINGGAFKLTIRPRVHADDPLAYLLQSSGGDRVGRSSGLYKLVRISGMTLDKTEVMPEPSGGFLTLTLSPGTSMGPGIVRVPALATGGRTIVAGGGGAGGTTRPFITYGNTLSGGGAPVVTYSSGAFGGSGGGGGISGTSAFTFGGRSSASSQGTLDLDPAKMQQLSPGPHSAELKLEVKVTPSPILRSSSAGSYRVTFPANADQNAIREATRKQQAQASRDLFASAGPTLADVEVKLPAKLEIVPANETTIQRVDDEKLRSQVEASISVSRVRMISTRLDVTVACSNPPTDLSYDIIVRQGDKEWPAGVLVMAHGEGVRAMMGNMNWVSGSMILPQDGPSGDYPVDVIFRPNPAPAMSNPSINSYWGGEIVVKNLLLDRQTQYAPVPAIAAGSGGFNDSLNLARRIASRGGSGPLVNLGSGLLLRIEIRPMKDGKMIDDGPKVSREMLVYADVPFMQKFSSEDGATTTKISGSLNPANVGNSTEYHLDLDYSIINADGTLKSRDTFNDMRNITLGKPWPVVKTGTDNTSKMVTLTLQAPN